MEDEESTRPTIGFPLGLALLVILLVSMAGLFTCCLHWDKLRAVLGASSDEDNSNVDAQEHHSQCRASPPHLKKAKQNGGQSVPVLMPGDQVPTFIAMACPCEPQVPVADKITVVVEKPPPFPVPLC